MKHLQPLRLPFQLLTFISMFFALYAIFIYAPNEKTMGVVQKIFYIHLPAAILAYLAFFITFLASILYLWRRDPKWDVIAFCAVEVGVVFCTIVLITGPIWARPVWNVWWIWDPRLTTTLIMWLIYAAYLMLRRSVSEDRRPSLAAVYGIVGFINVPITFFSIRLFRTIHPVIITSSGIHMTGPMKLTLAVSFAAFSLLFITLLSSRIKIERLSLKIEDYKEVIENITQIR